MRTDRLYAIVCAVILAVEVPAPTANAGLRPCGDMENVEVQGVLRGRMYGSGDLLTVEEGNTGTCSIIEIVYLPLPPQDPNPLPPPE